MADKPIRGAFDFLRSKIIDTGREAKKSLAWYMANIKSLPHLRKTPDSILMGADRNLLVKKLEVGRMYFMAYDPKHKLQLPYYDTFPLILPIEATKDGFYGMNLHYMDYKSRFYLLNELQNIAAGSTDDLRKIKMSWALLRKFSKLAPIHSATKRYLSSHVRSHFVTVKYSDWVTASLLPVERFQKARKDKVWADSKRRG